VALPQPDAGRGRLSLRVARTIEWAAEVSRVKHQSLGRGERHGALTPGMAGSPRRTAGPLARMFRGGDPFPLTPALSPSDGERENSP
jgi:hypothetical protein